MEFKLVSEELNQLKTPENIAKAISKFKKNVDRHPIGIDLYLTKKDEEQALEKWSNLKNKKAFILLCLNNSDKILELFSKEK